MDILKNVISVFQKPTYNHEQCKVHLKLSLNRLKLQKTKKESLNDMSKREVVTMMTSNKHDSAIVKAENLIKEKHVISALSLLEVEIEHVLVRLDTMKTSNQPPPDLLSAIATIVYSSTRLNIKELKLLVPNLQLKYGNTFIHHAMSNHGNICNPKIVEELSLARPPKRAVFDTLKSIATSNNLKFDDQLWLMELNEDSLNQIQDELEEDSEEEIVLPNIPSTSPGTTQPPETVPDVPDIPMFDAPGITHQSSNTSDIPDVPDEIILGPDLTITATQTTTTTTTTTTAPNPFKSNQNFQNSNNYQAEDDDDDLDLPSVPTNFDDDDHNNNSGGYHHNPHHHHNQQQQHHYQHNSHSNNHHHMNASNNNDDDDDLELQLPSVLPHNNNNMDQDGDDLDLPEVPQFHMPVVAYSYKEDKTKSNQHHQQHQQTQAPDEDELTERLKRLQKKL
eukprot:TRINITY_DN689_c8_g1_i1.p1 TRINITY_DN689_c8_g1~~TRINITY_DN689_c8_g1_i1.p1  ORF type:complete len:449 (+),score=133.14 TRINITY_DN689_c8_g1_i1:53-1399(+)